MAQHSIGEVSAYKIPPWRKWFFLKKRIPNELPKPWVGAFFSIAKSLLRSKPRPYLERSGELGDGFSI